MKSRSIPPQGEHFYILDAKNRPVEVFDRSEWSRWLAGNELVFRRTLLEESGVTVTTRFRGVAAARTGEPALFVTRIAGMKAREENESFGASTLAEALERHERIVQKILRKLSGR
ncbi:hypothetical protein [Paraburkholderia acidiphila]|uniref:Uncharacterized protein n=1 Tax=Paraburkholderia acidiphila TaxID=2571747 RepID=A0A7Z2GBM1_9BURK|nr:hypothetical protein [Paraburkholderia acidiphila]QGZ58770.1 hypothetical protein FAZ97_27820 [Paraburkholderia acidiphila]